VDQELLAVVPKAVKLVHVGAGDGAFAKAYKQRNPVCNYFGIERDLIAAEQARAHCDFVYQQDIETPDESRDRQMAQADCWLLDGALERARDPWALLAMVRASMAPQGALVVSVRNFQNWSNLLRLAVGDYRYAADGVLQRDELRQFTRGSLLELLGQAGFRLTGGYAVQGSDAVNEGVLPVLRQLAQLVGRDPEQVVQDALPQRFILLATPA